MEKKGDSRYPHPDELRKRRQVEQDLAERAAEAASRQPVDERPAMSGLVIWLAKRLREDPYELAKRFPADTLRRLKYPFASEKQADGSTRFRSIGVVAGKELIHAPTTPGSTRDAIRGGIEVKP